jgi:hypothetical protein
MFLDVFILSFQIYVGWGAGFLHFSPRSRDQLKAHVLTFHHLLPSPAPSLVSNAAPKKSCACCHMEDGIVPVSPQERRAAFQEWIPLGERKTPD